MILEHLNTINNFKFERVSQLFLITNRHQHSNENFMKTCFYAAPYGSKKTPALIAFKSPTLCVKNMSIFDKKEKVSPIRLPSMDVKKISEIMNIPVIIVLDEDDGEIDENGYSVMLWNIHNNNL